MAAKYTHVQETISAKQEEKWRRKRHREDGVSSLPAGVTMKDHGRAGFIYYSFNGKVSEVFWEMSGSPESDIQVSPAGFNEWVWPKTEKTTPDERQYIEVAVTTWLAERGYRTVFGP